MESAKQFIKEAKEAYYNGSPIISDSQYDALVEIYGEDYIGTKDGEVLHYKQLYSLKKYFTDENDIADLIWGEFDNFVGTYKYDGAAISLLYVNKELVQALTRGDGERGKDITHLLKDSLLIPSYLPDAAKSEVIFVTGEVVAPKNIKNARNYAAGALGLKLAGDFDKKELYFKAYGLWPRTGAEESYYSDDLAWLNKLGFDTVKKIDEDEWEFPTDGEVWRVDCNREFDRLGYTSQHPRGAFALKERSEGIKTRILDVIWQTGKTGKVTPVAILSPIEIEDAQVSRATLNNVGFIESLDLQIGDSVMVERAGGIIPRIIKKAENVD